MAYVLIDEPFTLFIFDYLGAIDQLVLLFYQVKVVVTQLS